MLTSHDKSWKSILLFFMCGKKTKLHCIYSAHFDLDMKSKKVNAKINIV